MRSLIILLMAITIIACNKTIDTADNAIFEIDAAPEIKMEDFQQWLSLAQNDPQHPYNSFVIEETDGQIEGFSLMVKYGTRPVIMMEEIEGPHFNEEALNVLADAEADTQIWLDSIRVLQPDGNVAIMEAAYEIVE